MSLNTALLFVCLFVASLLLSNSASANYIEPAEKEKYIFLSDSWRIVEKPKRQATNKDQPQPLILATHGPLFSGDNIDFIVEVKLDGQQRNFTVDMFNFAHHINSNTICGGNYQIVMQNYIRDLEKVKPPPEALLIKVSSIQDNGELTVAGMWPFNSDLSWEKATQQGSHVLDLSAEKVRKLGSAKAYKEALLKKSKEQWALINARKTN